MRLAVIPGDGIGPEVIDEALKVLNEVVPAAEITRYDLGAARWHATGELLPESVLGELRQHDAILLGAVGDPSVPSGILERGLLLRLRFELDHHVNLRPARLYPGVRGPLASVNEIDMVVVREGTEGPYVGTGGILRKDTPHEIATEVSTNTAFGDILTDLAAAITGGIGLAASGNLDVSRRNPSMFEPVHGSAPDIAGQGIADPTAAVLSVALLLDHLGNRDAARRIEAAVAFDLATRDHSATGHTQSIGDRLAALVSSHANAPS